MKEVMTETADTAASPAPQKPFPRIWPTIGWIVGFFAIQLFFTVATFVVLLALNYSPGSPIEDWLAILKAPEILSIGTLWSLTFSSLATIFLLWRYCSKGDRAVSVGLNHWGKMGWGKALAYAVPMLVGAMLVSQLYQLYLIPDVKVQATLQAIIAAIPKTAFYSALTLLAVAILGPAAEELLFRGLLQNSLKHKMPVHAAIMLSSLIFSLIHITPGDAYWGLPAIPGLFFVSLSFGYIYHLTGSLRMNIALHMANNMAAIIWSWTMGAQV
jgi:uncharacterized protein